MATHFGISVLTGSERDLLQLLSEFGPMTFGDCREAQAKFGCDELRASTTSALLTALTNCGLLSQSPDDSTFAVSALGRAALAATSTHTPAVNAALSTPAIPATPAEHANPPHPTVTSC